MIEILGIKITYEALGFLAAFVVSEVIGASKLQNNSVAGLLKSIIDGQKPFRKEDEKVEAIKAQIAALYQEIQTLGE
ncbi:hypothetical protein S-CBP2_0047 [Synechococcus phage S-CBP2]|uniref:Uncharacterized protein n=1 Tax=Synechococcus phage S-CBP2 TaxID=756277 RepID=A0A096VL18_9CAUD|nr:hypothetical protein S-CBP2_0047 [Synechococcus phage S-CBP2]AGF91071.1 hypothetical protein SXHG_00049 [Synechococcus phage MRHenn-2013a]AGK86753.1 hypothetical protein S-CBP2_0047 [Synechococcus phage S-CBP2]